MAEPPQTLVDLSFSCRNLPSLDLMSASDPYITIEQQGATGWQQVGKTEMLNNSRNPDFTFRLRIVYFFEASQKLRFTVWDSDGKKSEKIGEVCSTLGAIVGMGIHPQISNITKTATLHIRSEEVSGCTGIVAMQWRGITLDKKDLFGKSDPYLQFSKKNDDGNWSVVYKTEVIRNTLNPTWKPGSLPLATICKGDINRPVRIECFDWDSDGSHDLIGIVEAPVDAWVRSIGSNSTFECINEKKRAKNKKYVNSGTLQLLSCSVFSPPSFLDYLAGGTSLNFSVAIDFTGSNGDPRNPTSLHYMNPLGPNQYQEALWSVGTVIQDYDADQLYPAFGFGGKLPSGVVSHCFSLTGDERNPYCQGIAGIEAAYRNSIGVVQLYGPTNFANIIASTISFANSQQKVGGVSYFVLMIITDGEISDMANTKREIIKATLVPMSIIIIGVGEADFSSMKELDGDDAKLSMDGQTAARDIVQFVSMRSIPKGPNRQASLAKAVLEELPSQVLEYMKINNISPGPRKMA